MEGRPGDLVRVRVQSDRPDEVSAIRLIVGYELNEALTRSGDAWVLEQEIPFEAPPGTYNVVFQAYDRGYQPTESAERSFQVGG